MLQLPAVTADLFIAAGIALATSAAHARAAPDAIATMLRRSLEQAARAAP